MCEDGWGFGGMIVTSVDCFAYAPFEIELRDSHSTTETFVRVHENYHDLWPRLSLPDYREHKQAGETFKSYRICLLKLVITLLPESFHRVLFCLEIYADGFPIILWSGNAWKLKTISTAKREWIPLSFRRVISVNARLNVDLFTCRITLSSAFWNDNLVHKINSV